jgi:DinB family protein
MGQEHLLARAVLTEAFTVFDDNVRSLTLDEFLDAAGGYRSILGLTKHTVGWTVVYHSYAFEEPPRPWDAIDWPRGLRDTIDVSDGYAREMLAWFDSARDAWLGSVAAPVDLASVRPLHGGDTAPLRDIVAMAAGHITYHAGEVNEILAIRRGEANEIGEEVEENHIDTRGHRVRPAWMDRAPDA